MISELTKLGLTLNEAKVYFALLNLGSTNAGEIIKKTKLHRNIVYDNLEKLIEKGLVGFVLIKNIKHFEVASSEELKEYVNRKREEILNEEKIMKELLPQIEKLKISSERKQEATIFRGKKGLKTISKSHREIVSAAIEELKEHPTVGRPLGRELSGKFSVRLGLYRVVYKINFEDKTVLVVNAGHRSRVYN